MAGRFFHLIVMCAAAVLVAGCLSIDVDKTEKNSANQAPADAAEQAIAAESAE